MDTYWSFSASASRSAPFSTPSSLGEICVAAPWVRGSAPSARSRSWRMGPVGTPILPRAAGTTPPSWPTIARSRCSGVTSGWSLFSAWVCAAAIASCALTVN